LAFPPQSSPSQEADIFAGKRREMVERQIVRRGVTDRGVIRAMTAIPRHLFVPPAFRSEAYGDHALPIDEGQTISQPYIVALMSQCLSLKKGEKVLEIGTGSGYQAAILSQLTDKVFTIEIHEFLARKASKLLASLGLDQVRVRHGDGFFGWGEEAPFDAIILTCATPQVPAPLFDQLVEGGRMILPLGDPSSYQILTLITKKKGDSYDAREILDVRFVPMTGAAGKIKRRPGESCF
jgi:protein-L-isoaspartate(D-aspartate) O-methyltransferase